ncbi:hypothetical protein NQ317_006476 [Molorchus minor]|uniref:Protein odr-4 homolog n=1 Tax=Molorchus minor TaxID=1323400 RepID=A0ABQ9J5X3_9CUCU|nr:hypothetical protein NQ317_006476 [Molorchus minor]
MLLITISSKNGRSAVADDYLLSYITDIAKENPYSVGLILGQSCLGKDYIIHFAKTPPFQSEELKNAGVPAKDLKSISDINESWVADHARHATRMLQGGMYVLGIFVVSPEDVLSPFHPKVKSILSSVHRQLGQSKYLYGNTDNEKIIVSYSTKLKNNIECNFEIDRLHYLKSNEAEWPLQKHIKVILENVEAVLDQAVYLFDGESKDGDEKYREHW